MKKYITKITWFLMLCVLSTGCSEDFMELNKGNNTLTLTSSDTQLVLNELNHSADGIELDWTTGTNNGTGNRISYTLELAANGVTYKQEMGSEVYSWKKTVSELNAFITNEFGADFEQQTSVNARVVAHVAECDDMEQVAETSFTVTTYKPVTTTLYLIGGATPTGWNADSPTEMSCDDNGYFTWIGKLNSNGTFKMITTKGEFTPSYNRDANDENGLTLVYRESEDDPDGQFSVDEDGNYKVEVDLLRMTIKVTPSTEDPQRFEDVFFVGSFTGWGFERMTPDALRLNLWHYGRKFEWNDGGEFKFGTTKGWDNMLFAGESNAPYTSSKVVYQSDDDNKWFLLESECGKAYKIVLDVTKGKEQMLMKPFTPYECLYLVGDATPSGWNLPATAAMTADETGFIMTWTGNLNTGSMKISCDNQTDWMGAWFMPTKADLVPTGEKETTVFVDKSDADFAGLYPDLNIGDVDMKWKITEAGNYTITINQLTEEISIVKN